MKLHCASSALLGAKTKRESERKRCIAVSIHSHGLLYDLKSLTRTDSMDPYVNVVCASSTISSALTNRSLAVDFIDNRLPAYHIAFQGLPPFDPVSRKYTLHAAECKMQNHVPLVDSRPLWTGLFPLAMSRVKGSSTEPKELRGSKYRVRDRDNWTDVQVRLQAAQASYIQALGIRGWVRRSRRVLADNSQVAVQTAKLVPGSDMTSPVINVVQNLLEVGS